MPIAAIATWTLNAFIRLARSRNDVDDTQHVICRGSYVYGEHGLDRPTDAC